MSVGKWIKQEKLRELTIAELRDRAAELKATMFTNRFQQSTGKLDNFRIIPETRRRLAAVLTLISEKERDEKAKRQEASE